MPVPPHRDALRSDAAAVSERVGRALVLVAATIPYLVGAACLSFAAWFVIAHLL